MKQKIYFQKLMKGRFEFVFPTAQEIATKNEQNQETFVELLP